LVCPKPPPDLLEISVANIDRFAPAPDLTLWIEETTCGDQPPT